MSKHAPSRCPSCKSLNIHRKEQAFSTDDVVAYMECYICKSSWTETYKFTSYAMDPPVYATPGMNVYKLYCSYHYDKTVTVTAMNAAEAEDEAINLLLEHQPMMTEENVKVDDIELAVANKGETYV